MRINIIAVGKIKEKYFIDAIEEYAKRISRFAEIQIIECAEFPPKAQSDSAIKLSQTQEGKAILSKMKGFCIATAIDGELVSSEGLAQVVDKKCAEGVSEISFIIGGSNGLSEEVYNKVDKRISFGRVTYPHQLMRVILSEQIYRALAINNNLPYHK